MHNGNTQINVGTGIVTGKPTTAFRAELYGVTAWYCCLYHLHHYLQYSPTASIKAYTDNTKVISYHHLICNKEDPPTAFIDDFDLFQMINKYHHHLINAGFKISEIGKVKSNY